MNYLKISLLAACFIFCGCKKDNGNGISIINTYDLTEAKTDDGQLTFGIGALKTTQEYTFTGEDYNVILTINEDNTFTSQGTYTQLMVIEGVGAPGNQRNPFPNSGTWSLDKNVLTLTSADETDIIEFEIFTQTKDRLEGQYIKQNTAGLETNFATVGLKFRVK